MVLSIVNYLLSIELDPGRPGYLNVDCYFMRRILLLCVVVLSVGGYAHAQSTCAQTLRLAQSIYDQGRLHELPQLLDNCLKENQFNDEEKVNAYKLLTLTYIYLE